MVDASFVQVLDEVCNAAGPIEVARQANNLVAEHKHFRQHVTVLAHLSDNATPFQRMDVELTYPDKAEFLTLNLKGSFFFIDIRLW